MLTFIRLFSKIDLTFRLFQQLLKGQKGLGLVFLQNSKKNKLRIYLLYMKPVKVIIDL